MFEQPQQPLAEIVGKGRALMVVRSRRGKRLVVGASKVVLGVEIETEPAKTGSRLV